MIIPAMLAAPAAPILLLTQTGHFAAAAFLITTAFYAASCAKAAAAEKKPQTELAEFSPTYRAEFSPTYRPEIHRTNQRPIGKGELIVSVSVSQSELAKSVAKLGWECWSSNLKLNGLMLIVADATERTEKGIFRFGSDRSRLLCSPLRPKDAAAQGAPREALEALINLGVFKLEKPGCRAPHARVAEYRFTPRYASRPRFKVRLEMTPAQLARWHDRHDRVRECYEQRHPIIGAVRTAAARIELSAQGFEALLRLRTDAPDSLASAERCHRWLQAPTSEDITHDRTGTLHSPISQCPRLIRPHLLLDRQDVAEVDISGAHIAVLPKLYDPAFLDGYGIKHTGAAAELERQTLVAQIESGDVYGGATEQERKRNKKELLTSLNMAVRAQMAMPVTQKLIAGRPILAALMIAVKATDHRALSRYLQRWTSDTVNESVLALHARGIPSIPIVDCLMVRRQDEVAAREELSSRLYVSTGVCAKVGGIRYTPPALSTNATLIAA
jgi:hypothetical protein